MKTKVKKKFKTKVFDAFSTLLNDNRCFISRRPNPKGTERFCVYSHDVKPKIIISRAEMNALDKVLKQEKSGKWAISKRQIRRLHGKNKFKIIYKEHLKNVKMNTDNLLTEEGRISALKKIKDGFLQSLRKVIHVAENATCSLSNNHISIGISKSNGNGVEFASEVALMKYSDGFKLLHSSTSGFFTANDTPLYWRTVHAANILQNWSKVCELAEKHTKMYDELTKEIFRVNSTEKNI